MSPACWPRFVADLGQDRGGAAGRPLGGRRIRQPDEDADLAVDGLERKGDLAPLRDVLVAERLGQPVRAERARQLGLRTGRRLGVHPGRREGRDEQERRAQRADATVGS